MEKNIYFSVLEIQIFTSSTKGIGIGSRLRFWVRFQNIRQVIYIFGQVLEYQVHFLDFGSDSRISGMLFIFWVRFQNIRYIFQIFGQILDYQVHYLYFGSGSRISGTFFRFWVRFQNIRYIIYILGQIQLKNENIQLLFFFSSNDKI